MVWIYYLILFVVLIAGWLVTILTLPGLWLMAGALALYGLITHWGNYVGWTSVIVMLVLAGIAELVEILTGAAGSKFAGARRRGMIGAVVGSIAGAILFSGLVPIPIVGTIIGVCLGAFFGAALAERFDRDFKHAVRVGIGAAGGRFVGIVTKLGFGFVMLLIGMIAARPFWRAAGATPPPAIKIVLPQAPAATLPTTLP